MASDNCAKCRRSEFEKKQMETINGNLIDQVMQLEEEKNVDRLTIEGLKKDLNEEKVKNGVNLLEMKAAMGLYLFFYVKWPLTDKLSKYF